MITESFLKSLDLSTRAKRRRTMLLVIEILKHIKVNEENAMNNMPLNLQSGEAYDNADYSVDCITDAVDCLSDAY